MKRRLPALLASTALAAAGLTGVGAVSAAPAQAADITCSDSGSGRFDYPGPAASKTYDDRFHLGHRVPDSPILNGFIPQGLGTWPNWGGPGKDLVLLTAYNDASSYSVLIGLIPGSGQTHTVRLPKSHVGGVSVVNGHLFVSGQWKQPKTGKAYPTIDRYSLSEARTKLARGGTLTRLHSTKLLDTRRGSSFLAVYGNTLFAGTFNKDHRDTMYRYSVSDKGGLSAYGAALPVPKKTQGLVVTKNEFVFSTSYTSEDRGNLYVMRRSYTDLDTAYAHRALKCFRAPSMNEGITRTNGTLYVAFESGSYKYRSDPCNLPLEQDCTRNIIKHLHRATLTDLTSLV